MGNEHSPSSFYLRSASATAIDVYIYIYIYIVYDAGRGGGATLPGMDLVWPATNPSGYSSGIHIHIIT